MERHGTHPYNCRKEEKGWEDGREIKQTALAHTQRKRGQEGMGKEHPVTPNQLHWPQVNSTSYKITFPSLVNTETSQLQLKTINASFKLCKHKLLKLAHKVDLLGGGGGGGGATLSSQ